ncbi:hypothetical protein CFB3_21280 [Clostridium folliculivorans]|uniref:Uncharacterized protein n=1 Tax=Clostridium folliculivorans TaxID=2886038 RepID=A0A9W5XZS1_9CLOT|nr:hypothetical protein CFOLD11_07320 [Clostridium folliculivorans]GKU30021.1 hypothetical protein CFB3_21280 [Clostridium folliculivorans]
MGFFYFYSKESIKFLCLLNLDISMIPMDVPLRNKIYYNVLFKQWKLAMYMTIKF